MSNTSDTSMHAGVTEPITLEEATIPLPDPEADQRKTLPEPPPVWLVAVEDVRLPTVATARKKLDAFYRDLLKFDVEAEGAIYRAENCRLRFDVVESISDRADFRAFNVEVPLLLIFEKLLIEREIEYEKIKGIALGEQSILLRDPAGNLVQVNERRELI